jgi:hypothetical protein
MERALTEEELAARHRHLCMDCGAIAARSCYCADGADGAPNRGQEFAFCRWRIPGERNLDCPSLKGVGGENLTQAMLAEHGLTG